jgi:hypothetical protein
LIPLSFLKGEPEVGFQGLRPVTRIGVGHERVVDANDADFDPATLDVSNLNELGTASVGVRLV